MENYKEGKHFFATGSNVFSFCQTGCSVVASFTLRQQSFHGLSGAYTLKCSLVRSNILSCVTDLKSAQPVCPCHLKAQPAHSFRLQDFQAHLSLKDFPPPATPAPTFHSFDKMSPVSSRVEQNKRLMPAYVSFCSCRAMYGALDLVDVPRRKATTRETTGPLKVWLSDHKDNPYPTKAEKIMLAVITRMTLTQVSTWFANARRRLKKDRRLFLGGREEDMKLSLEEQEEDVVGTDSDGEEDPDSVSGDRSSDKLSLNKAGSGSQIALSSDSENELFSDTSAEESDEYQEKRSTERGRRRRWQTSVKTPQKLKPAKEFCDSIFIIVN